MSGLLTLANLFCLVAQAQRILRAQFIGQGSHGGSCGLCHLTWLCGDETHLVDCPIAANQRVIDAWKEEK